MFGGEGLFVTEMRGPGRVWLQGMPPDRMIAEIASRVPSRGPGIGIPIGMGGASDGAGEGGGEEMAAASDAAIDADRQATVASSGAMSSDDTDADSQSALFGDAVPEDATTPLDDSTNTDTGDDFSWASTSDEPMFEDSQNEFSTGDSEELTFDDSGFQNPTTFESTEDAVSEAAEGSRGLLSTIWDIFMSDD